MDSGMDSVKVGYEVLQDTKARQRNLQLRNRWLLQKRTEGSTTATEQTDLGKLNDDELVNTLGEAQKAEKGCRKRKETIGSGSE
jgi:hypothetical protein